MRKEKEKKGRGVWSVQTAQDLVIALGTFAVACIVVALITMPVISSAVPNVLASAGQCPISAASVIAKDIDCDTEMELPPGSAIWICRYLVYSNETGQLIGIDLCRDDDWLEYGELINELTGLDSKSEWETLYADMFRREPYVKEYLLDQGFYVISCVDCDCFWYLIDQANKCDCPVKIAMYDCCCVVFPVIPVFVY